MWLDLFQMTATQRSFLHVSLAQKNKLGTKQENALIRTFSLLKEGCWKKC